MPKHSLIKKIDSQLLRELSVDYRRLVLREKIKKDLTTIGEISGKIILVAGVLAGAVVLAAIAPNIIGAMGKLNLGKKKKIYFNCKERQFNQSLSYLKKQELIRIVEGDTGSKIVLTDKGEQRFQMYLLENIKIFKPKRWDGRWRLVIFDIGEQMKTARDALRQKLNNLGFQQIQKSVFVFPYPCEKEIDFVKQFFGLEGQVKLIEAGRFRGDEGLKNYFEL